MIEVVEPIQNALHWTEYFRAVGPTLVGVFVAYVAWQQWSIARRSLNEKLFDRRFEVYTAARDMMIFIVRSGEDEKYPIGALHRIDQQTGFLFPKEVDEFLQLLIGKALRHRSRRNYCKQIEHLDTEVARSNQTDAMKEMIEIEEWCDHELKTLGAKFGPSMSLLEGEGVSGRFKRKLGLTY